MRGAFLLALPLAFVSAGCSSEGACLLDSDCADFSMICVDRQCVPPGATDAGARDAGRVDSGIRDAGAQEDDAGPLDAGTEDGDGAVGDGGTEPCTDVSGEWRVMPADPGSCGGSAEIVVTVTAGAAVCEFALSDPLTGTVSVAADGTVTGTLGGTECTGTVEPFVLSCGACEFTLER